METQLKDVIPQLFGLFRNKFFVFSLQDSQHTARGENFQEVVKRCWSLKGDQLIAVGCNCLSPKYVTTLIRDVNNGLPEKIPLIVYPNSGEVYSPEKG